MNSSELTVVLEPVIAQKLQFAINRNEGTLADVEWLSTGDNFKKVSFLARGEAELTIKAKPAAEPEPESVIDPIIRVDRSVRPSYPEWTKTVMHPELEVTGPAEYDINKVEQWLLDSQKEGGLTRGTTIHNHLKDTKMLKICLGLRDLEEIQKKGVTFFRKYFKGKAVFAWQGVVLNRNGRLFVPYLCESGDEVVLVWDWLDDDFDGDDPALRHAS